MASRLNPTGCCCLVLLYRGSVVERYNIKAYSWLGGDVGEKGAVHVVLG